MKHTIEIEGLPEGWEPVAIRKQKLGEHILCLDTGFVVPADHRTPKAHLIVKKKQPRRIVLEETDERNVFNKSGELKRQEFSNGLIIYNQHKIWRVVEDTGYSGMTLKFKEELYSLVAAYGYAIREAHLIDNFDKVGPALQKVEDFIGELQEKVTDLEEQLRAAERIKGVKFETLPGGKIKFDASVNLELRNTEDLPEFLKPQAD